MWRAVSPLLESGWRWCWNHYPPPAPRQIAVRGEIPVNSPDRVFLWLSSPMSPRRKRRHSVAKCLAQVCTAQQGLAQDLHSDLGGEYDHLGRPGHGGGSHIGGWGRGPFTSPSRCHTRSPAACRAESTNRWQNKGEQLFFLETLVCL